MRSHHSIGLVALVCFGVSLPEGRAGAEVLCSKKKGAVIVRPSACKPRERLLDPSALGLKGEKGDPGAPGAAGLPGPFPSGDLPEGAMVRGVFGVQGTGDTATRASAAIAFAFPLPQAPEPHYIPKAATPPPQCPGTLHAPAAASGHLCLYEGAINNTFSPDIVDPESGIGPGTSRFGFMIQTAASFPGFFTVSGTWAAAP